MGLSDAGAAEWSTGPWRHPHAANTLKSAQARNSRDSREIGRQNVCGFRSPEKVALSTAALRGGNALRSRPYLKREQTRRR